MSVIASPMQARVAETADQLPTRGARHLIAKSGRVVVGGGVLMTVLLLCIFTLPWTLNRNSKIYYAGQAGEARGAPTSNLAGWLGYDALGRSMLGRCLLGGTISLAVGAAAATISVILGSGVGLIAGYSGGWVDSVLMRIVDVLYGLPYILLVILFK